MHNSRRFAVAMVLSMLVSAQVRVMAASEDLEDRTPADADAPWKHFLAGDEARQVADLEARMKELCDAAKYADAIPLAVQGLEIRTRAQGRDHWEAADARRMVATLVDIAALTEAAQAELAGLRKLEADAQVRYAQGLYADAVPLAQRLLDVRRRHLGEQHSFVALALLDLGQMTQAAGKQTEAEAMFRQALDISRTALGEEHPTTAEGLEQLAVCFDARAKYADAELLHRRALALQTRLLGEHHASTMLTGNNLAANLLRQAKFAEAENLLREVLESRRCALGDDHAATARSYGNLAIYLNQQGKLAEAHALFERALAVEVAANGEEHPDTAEAYQNLANNLDLQDQFAEAEPLHRRALAVFTKLLAPDHLRVAKSQDNLAMNLSNQAKYAEAQPLLERSLATRRHAPGEDHPDTATAYNNLAVNLYRQGKFAQAQPLLERTVAIRRSALGVDNPATAMAYNNLANDLNSQGKYAEAQSAAAEALSIDQRVFGEDHIQTAAAYNILAEILDRRCKFADAEPFHRRALTISAQVLGEKHSQSATAHANLAANLQRQGRYAEADRLHRRAISLVLEVLGPGDPETARGYLNLAYNLQQQGSYTVADVWFRKCLIVQQRVLGEVHPSTATALNLLAVNLTCQGRHVEAGPLFRRALMVQQQVLPQAHPAAISTSIGLAMNLFALGEFAQAETLLREALAVTSNSWDEQRTETVQLHNNLAVVVESQGNLSEAESLLRQALAICEGSLGVEHPLTATEYRNLASVLNRLGEHDEAESLCRKALGIQQRRLGGKHPDSVRTVIDLALILNSRGRHVDAERGWLAAIEGFEAARMGVSSSGLERSAFTADTSPFVRLSAVQARLGKDSNAWDHLEANLARGLFDEISARLARPLDDADARREADLFGRSEALGKQVAALAEAKANGPDADEQLTELRSRHDAILAELSIFEAELAEKYGPAAGQSFSAAQVQKAIEPDEALAVWIDIAGNETDADPNGEHWVGLLRQTGKPVWSKLPGSGRRGAWTKDDGQLAASVRKLLVQAGDAADDWQTPARKLYSQRLAPLADLLAGSGELPIVRRLVVLPSPGMDGVPLEPLLEAFGRRQDITVSYAPSGTVFAWLREKRSAEPARPARSGPTRLLALGDPAFRPAETTPSAEPPDHGAYLTLVAPGSNAERHDLRPGDVVVTYGGAAVAGTNELKNLVRRRPPPEKVVPAEEADEVALEVWREGETLQLAVAPGPLGVQIAQQSAADAVRNERRFGEFLQSTRGDTFQPLPGTRREVQAIGRFFPHADVLLGTDASVRRVDELATSGRLGEFDVLHFATHGQLDRRSPLESALVLSTTDPPDSREQDLSGDTIDDGRLTAAHIMRLWKLNADLAVLSACETGLGKYSGGEGFVGFSQALLLAGAQSLVLSQWKVDDTATALLMVRFYENLLGKREGLKGPLSKTEALAESKRWLRELSADEVEKLVADLPAVERVGKATGAPRPAVKSARPFSHPYYWAAFILIGDPE